MIEAVFISDLHLHPEEYEIQERFKKFLEWAKTSVKNIYILGDFFHVWAGDDSIDEWSRGIAQQLSLLQRDGIKIFYMHGNRDFLLGKQFAQLSGWIVLNEPTLIELANEKILLVHGDRYCTKDINHQRLRKLTRNKYFSAFFLKLPLKLRQQIVNRVRYHSEMNRNKTMNQMDVVDKDVIKHMTYYNVTQLIHGHTHKSGVFAYTINRSLLKRYVLSDWDDNPKLLCYDYTKGFYFVQG